MTTQDHSSHADHIVATFSDGEAARRAWMAIESAGIDSSRMELDTKSELTSHQAENRVDSAVGRRARNTAVQGIVVGAIIGAVVGLIVGFVLDVIDPWLALALFTIPGVILGAFFGVFWRLPTNPDIADSYVGGPVKLTLDLTALDDADRKSAVEKLQAEQPLRIAQS